MGIAILIPSGILWKLIASAKESPKLLLVDALKKVAIPSGILCIIIASIETSPKRYNFLLLKLLSKLFGKNLSINIEIITPKLINIKRNKRAGKVLKIEVNKLNDEGIKSVKQTQNITPLAKARADIIIFFSFLKLKNKKINPNKVDDPASVAKIKA